MDDRVKAVLDFWFAGDPDEFRVRWFRRDDAFDTEIGARFGDLPALGRDGTLDPWRATPHGALALCLVLDQFPRNLHRGRPDAFAFDAAARAVARQAVLQDRFDLAGLTAIERVFLYLPFEHSEDAADQDLSIALIEGLRDHPLLRAPGKVIDFAWRHWWAIRRFGRFPHRNAVLGRTTTPEEEAWLAAGGGF